MNGSTRLRWSDLASGEADGSDGQLVEITGWPATAEPAVQSAYLLLAPEPMCCAACLPSEPAACVEVFAAAPLPTLRGRLTLRGRWHRLRDDTLGWRYQLTGATAAPLLGRRGALLGASLLCLPVSCAGAPSPERAEAAHALLARHPGVDMHSHAGGLIRVRQAGGHAPFTPLATPMRDGGLAVACLAIVSDSPTHRVTPDGRIRPFRDPAPGELRGYAERGFARLRALLQDQGMQPVTSLAALAAARPALPAALVAAEGADFLEGDAGYLDTAYAREHLRHLQLTHYRVNELGDIQTEAPVHGGLTPFGADVIRRCERLGIIVDVAHGTEDLVRQAAAVATKPIVLSHTSLTTAPRPFTRRITAAHARLVAGTGGVIGIWPPGGLFPDLASLADGIARMADVVGVPHVGIGTDMMGLVGPSTLPDYRAIAALAAQLLERFSPDETLGILGGNYLRVAKACLA